MDIYRFVLRNVSKWLLPAINREAYSIATVTVLGHFRRACGATGEEYSHGLITFCVYANMVA